jgi:ABC-type multidrug transport system fused ATPase/permease subunit
MPQSPAGGELSPAAAWSQRVRKVGGYIQLAFAAFWLIRGALTIGGGSRPVIELRHLTKRYGPILAVDDLSFTVAAGQVTGFLGPNGNGKSTTLTHRDA